MAICNDSQMNGFRGLYLHPPFFKGAQPHALSFLFGCHFCLAALKGIKPSLHSWCRYLSVGRSILHWSCRPLTLHPDMGAACPFHSPSIWLALPAMTQFSEW